MDWEALLSVRLPAPWVPPIKDPLDTSNFDPYDESDYQIEPYCDQGGNSLKNQPLIVTLLYFIVIPFILLTTAFGQIIGMKNSNTKTRS